MQEVFSKTDDPSIPLCDQEFYELRLYDSDDSWKPGLRIMQSRATWSAMDREFMWDEIEVEEFSELDKAQERYAARRLALAKRGFAISDMDF